MVKQVKVNGPPKKTPNAGDLNDYVQLETELAKSRETVEKQRVHIRKLEETLRGLLAISKEQIEWLRDYVAARDTSRVLREQNEREAKSHNPSNPNTVGRHVTSFETIDTTRRWTTLAVRGANNYAERLEEVLGTLKGGA